MRFVHALGQGLENTEVFVFGTRLTRITRELRKRDVDTALTQVVDSVEDWSGRHAHRRGDQEFNYQWARRVLRSGATVVVISDGWDRGDPELLGREMARLQRSCRRLIWLNPLLGAPGYQPLTQGMRAAMPYIDEFLPIHNLQSLEALADLLGRGRGRATPPPLRAAASSLTAAIRLVTHRSRSTSVGHCLVLRRQGNEQDAAKAAPAEGRLPETWLQ